MLAGALCRLAADVPRASPHDMPQFARHIGRALLARNAGDSSVARTFSRASAYALYSRRSYATTRRATKPAATVKKAVKATSEKTPPKKKAAPATKKTAKKPAAKKTTKRAAKKPAAKKAAPRRVKKVLTEQEKERLKIRELRAKALKEPVTQRTLTAYHIFLAEFLAGRKGPEKQSEKLVQATKEFKTLTPAQLEHYNHLANEKNAANKAEFEKWIESYTPQQIRIANLARAKLRKRLADAQKRAPSHTGKLYDYRHVKAPLSSYTAFFVAKHASGDLKGIPVTEASKLIGAEWKALSDSEKQKYKDISQAQAAKRQKNSI